ncbi:DUF4268 domain-containing protein [Azohydromonas caseinilytica]|uniref:DUF4268 domain-containing protein n=1 Tax=Azohydromonas caseinilytica TaxID=2728836 RepID=A0A848F363_9BURK|nr:DUF4268 domain-containing protein [Azohydromonas caseinilytica]NML14507.1 DUF4268 domain-containing protein [Azohydromonas caseinilytica]
MYRIHRQTNRITALSQVTFSELGFTERAHLQEWLANQPDALGEELLIIQKEFDGFDDTKERLDLLAIDKSGALVIIENKLDDSGRNVVWQSLKYAAYCSALSKTQVAEIFQRYLDKLGPGCDAKSIICEFLGKEEFEEVTLNHGTNQRLIMVAAEFRKEVTSAVLWLLKHNVLVKCFRAKPYQDGADLFLTIEQLIPLPEAEELMIGVSEKEVEEQAVERGEFTRHQLRLEFWQKTLEALEQAGVKRYANVTPGHDHWLNAGSGLSGVHYSMIFTRHEVRVSFELARTSKEENKGLFDVLQARASELDGAYGAPLSWRRMGDKKASIIEIAREFDGHNRDNWPDMIDWLVEQVQRMVRVFEPEISKLRAKIRDCYTL